MKEIKCLNCGKVSWTTESTCLYCDEPYPEIYQLKYELEDKICILEETLEKIYSSGWFEQYKKDKKLCPTCNNILIQTYRCPKDMINFSKIYDWCNCGYYELSTCNQISMKSESFTDIFEQWNIVNNPKHSLESLKLKYIEELNLINIAIEDLTNDSR